MKKRNVRIAACTIAAAITFSGMTLPVYATDNTMESILPSAGIDFSLAPADSSTSLSDIKEEVDREASKNLTASTGEVSISNVG